MEPKLLDHLQKIVVSDRQKIAMFNRTLCKRPAYLNHPKCYTTVPFARSQCVQINLTICKNMLISTTRLAPMDNPDHLQIELLYLTLQQAYLACLDDEYSHKNL